MSQVTLTLELVEVPGVIQSLRASIAQWMVMAYTDSALRRTSLKDAQEVIGSMVTAYQKALMLAQAEGIGTEVGLVSEFLFPDDIWELVDQFLEVETWRDLPAKGNYPWLWNFAVKGQDAHLIEALAEMI